MDSVSRQKNRVSPPSTLSVCLYLCLCLSLTLLLCLSHFDIRSKYEMYTKGHGFTSLKRKRLTGKLLDVKLLAQSDLLIHDLEVLGKNRRGWRGGSQI